MDTSMWDERYAASDLVWSAEPNLFLPPLVEGVEPGTALDIACGEGRNAIWLARRGWEVTAVDFSAVGIDKARRLGQDVDVDWVVADATEYDPARHFDLVLVFYLHLPGAQMAEVFDRAVAATRPGGTFFGVGHALRNLTDGYGGPPEPDLLWSVDCIAPLVAGLEVLELGERDRFVASADATAIDLAVHAVKPT
jgi:SAM-dependent methyltransferase